MNNTTNIILDFRLTELQLDFTYDAILIGICNYNKIYYTDSHTLINNYGMVLTSYKDYCNQHKKRADFLEFLEDSVKSDNMLCDSLQKKNFVIEDDAIVFSDNNEEYRFNNMGQFYVDAFQINVCGSYMFIRNLENNSSYLYYAD